MLIATLYIVLISAELLFVWRSQRGDFLDRVGSLLQLVGDIWHSARLSINNAARHPTVVGALLHLPISPLGVLHLEA
jgi:hypothetical protein